MRKSPTMAISAALLLILASCQKLTEDSNTGPKLDKKPVAEQTTQTQKGVSQVISPTEPETQTPALTNEERRTIESLAGSMPSPALMDSLAIDATLRQQGLLYLRNKESFPLSYLEDQGYNLEAVKTVFKIFAAKRGVLRQKTDLIAKGVEFEALSQKEGKEAIAEWQNVIGGSINGQEAEVFYPGLDQYERNTTRAEDIITRTLNGQTSLIYLRQSEFETFNEQLSVIQLEARILRILQKYYLKKSDPTRLEKIETQLKKAQTKREKWEKIQGRIKIKGTSF